MRAIIRKNRRFGRSRRGYSLLLTLVVLTYMAMLGLSLAGMAVVSSRVTMHRRDASAARNLAMAGIDEAAAQFKSSGSWSGQGNRTLGNGAMAVSISTPTGVPTRRIAVATGVVTGMNYTQTKRVRATFDNTGMAPLFYNALAAKTSFTINGTVNITSTPAAHQGNVYCNQDISLQGSSMIIDGYVRAAGAVSTSGSPTVTQGMLSGAPPMVFPEVDATFENQAVTNGITTPSGGTLSVTSASTLVKGKINGNLTVGSTGCKIQGVVWVTGNVTVSGPITGTGTLVCDGSLSLSGTFTVANGDTNNLMFITTSTSTTAVDLGGNKNFKGLIYAPYGGVRLHGTPTLIGGVMANSVTFSGTPNITRWTDFDQSPPTMPNYFQLKAWEELDELPQ